MNMTMMLALALSTHALAENTAPNVANGQEISAGVCAGCHSADGNSIIPVNPSLAGQHEEYIIKQLMEFKMPDEETPAIRNSPVMSAMVAALSVDDMKDLAAFYAQQTPTTGISTETDEDVLALGKIIYHGGNIENNVPACASCHSPDGSGIPPHYPKLSGQHADYTFSQLDAFNNEVRTNDGAVMKQVMSRMSPREKKAVSEYISGLK